MTSMSSLRVTQAPRNKLVKISTCSCIFRPYGPMLIKISTATFFFTIGNSLYPHITILSINLVEMDENGGSSSRLKTLTSEILQSAPNNPKLNLKSRT